MLGTFEKVPPLVEAGNDLTLSGRVPGLASFNLLSQRFILEKNTFGPK
jgi:hypothetical protein